MQRLSSCSNSEARKAEKRMYISLTVSIIVIFVLTLAGSAIGYQERRDAVSINALQMLSENNEGYLIEDVLSPKRDAYSLLELSKNSKIAKQILASGEAGRQALLNEHYDEDNSYEYDDLEYIIGDMSVCASFYPQSPRYIPTPSSLSSIDGDSDELVIFDLPSNNTLSASSIEIEPSSNELIEPSAKLTNITRPLYGSVSLSKDINLQSDEVTLACQQGGEPTQIALSNLSLDGIEEIANDITAIEDTGHDVGVILLDLNVGNGIAYNVDKKIYSASTVKAPMVAYVLERTDNAQLDAELQENIPWYSEDFSVDGSSSLGRIMQATIEESSNGGYASLYYSFGGNDDYREWLSANNGNPDMHDGNLFAWYSTREIASLWINIYHYLRGQYEHSDYFADMLSSTNVSFIRDALNRSSIRSSADDADSISGSDAGDSARNASIWNKAGWCAGSYYSSDKTWNSTSDNAIISIRDKNYLLSIMSSMPYSERSENLITDLAESVISVIPEFAE